MRAKVSKILYTYKGKTEDRWLVTWTDLKGVPREKRFRNKRHADQYATRIDREVGDAIHVADSDTTSFKKAAQAYLKWINDRYESRNRDVSGYFHRSSRCQINKHVIPRLGHLKLNKISNANVKELFVEPLAQKYAHRSVCLYYGHVFAILKYAVEEQQTLIRNPLKDKPVKIPGQKKKRKDVPDYELIMHLFAYLAGPRPKWTDNFSWAYYRVFCSLAAFAGMRGGETCGLQWQLIDFANNEISVEINRSDVDGDKDPKTEAGRRKIPMSPILRRALLDQWEYWRRPTRGYVLRGRRGGPVLPHNVQQAFRAIMRGANLTKPGGKRCASNPDGTLSLFTLHALRHFAASAWLNSDMKLPNLQRIIGHKSITTTIDTYGHYLPGDDNSRDAMTQVATKFPALGGPVVIDQVPVRVVERMEERRGDEEKIPMKVVERLTERQLLETALPAGPLTMASVRHALKQATPVEELLKVGDEVVGEDGRVYSLVAPEGSPPWLQATLDHLRDGLELKAAAERVYRPRATVTQLLKRLGIGTARDIFLAVKTTRYARLMDAGYGDAEIADKTGMSLTNVWEYRIRREGRGAKIASKSLISNVKTVGHTKLLPGKTRENDAKSL
jgi:integrase